MDFANKGRINEYYRARFELDKQVDAQMLEEIHNALKESEKITDVNRCGDLYCFELQVEGLNNWDKGDYLVRSLEKMDLIIFGSFDIENQQVYALLKDKSQMPNIINYIDNAINGYKLISYKEEVMTDDLFLKINLS